MVHIVGLALPCFLSEWFLITVGLERAAGSEGLLYVSRLWLSGPGKGLLVCVRNKSTEETEGVLKAGETVFPGFPAVPDREEGGSQQRRGW